MAPADHIHISHYVLVGNQLHIMYILLYYIHLHYVHKVIYIFTRWGGLGCIYIYNAKQYSQSHSIGQIHKLCKNSIDP